MLKAEVNIGKISESAAEACRSLQKLAEARGS
jgi:hypothetical protein